MGKRSSNKHRAKKANSIVFYIKIYFLACILAVFVFGVSAIFFPNKPTFTCANSKTCNLPQTQSILNNTVGYFHGKKVYPPQIDLNSLKNVPVLSATTSTGTKHIYIDLSKQTLYAYQGSTLYLKARTSTGRWAPTPTGNFYIRQKLLSTLMAGGEGAAAYYLPNIRYTEYFYRDYALHEAYWHDAFGTTMSHGCVNLRYVDAKALYEWTDGPTASSLGTEVSVCDQITGNTECVQNNPITI